MRKQSTREKEVLDILKEHFPTCLILREVSYSKFFPKKAPKDWLYRAARKLKADIFISTYDLIIEIQGEQHYKPVAFGGNHLEAESRFYDQKMNDSTKERIVRELNKCSLLLIPYDEPIGVQSFIEAINGVVASKERGQTAVYGFTEHS